MKKGVFFCLLTALISGISIFINKFGVTGINPFVFAFLKNFLVAFFIFSLNSKKQLNNFKKLNSRDWLHLILIGLIGGSLPFLLFFKGLSLTNPADANFIHKTMFIWVGILGVLVLKEKINYNFLKIGFLLFIANFLLIKNLAFNSLKGNLLIFLATLLWSTETVISKKVLKTIPSITVAWGRMFFGTIILAGLLAFNNQLILLKQINWLQFSWIIITAALLLGYVTTWYKGLKEIPASLASGILLFGSPITTILDFILLKNLELKQLSGLLVIFFTTSLILKKANYVYRRN